MPYSSVNIDEIEPGGPGGVIRFVRRHLGADAFGFNYFEIPADREGYEHDETGSGQEEVLFVVSGSGHWRIDGEEVPVRAGSFVRVDPEARRCPVAGPDGLTFLAIGSRKGSYEPHGPF
jgi:mannose-6-phosphate isomerase-like protein (cupin superfamily)